MYIKVYLKYISIIITTTLIIPYLFIPSEINSTETAISNCRYTTVNRIICDSNYRNSMFREIIDKNNILEDTEGYKFTFVKEKLNGALINIEGSNILIPSLITASYISDSKTLITWSYTLNTGMLPWQKFKIWYLNKSVKYRISKAISKFKNSCSSIKDVYGLDIQVTNLNDSTLIAIKGVSEKFPTVADIYLKIIKLKKYAKLKNSYPTNFPMLNINKVGSKFLYMVALPIDKNLSPIDDIEPKRMLPGGKFLASNEITGNQELINKMQIYFENFKTDFDYSSPAIPFQSLITDRSIEKDSNKWITKLYYPIY